MPRQPLRSEPPARPRIRSTTVLTVRRDGQVALGADGQVSMGDTVAKPDAVKVRKIDDLGADGEGVLVGFAGSAADAFALLEKFEEALRARPEDLRQAAVDLAKLWRTDRMLRRLESLMAVADKNTSLLVSGGGDVIEPGDGVIGVGSGGTYAVAAARALLRHSTLDAQALCRESLGVAAEICVYTNDNLTVLTL
ncbi:MAG: ATP-dependent protease subunit HslV [Planctomycetota bacterium]